MWCACLFQNAHHFYVEYCVSVGLWNHCFLLLSFYLEINWLPKLSIWIIPHVIHTGIAVSYCIPIGPLMADSISISPFAPLTSVPVRVWPSVSVKFFGMGKMRTLTSFGQFLEEALTWSNFPTWNFQILPQGSNMFVINFHMIYLIYHVHCTTQHQPTIGFNEISSN